MPIFSQMHRTDQRCGHSRNCTYPFSAEYSDELWRGEYWNSERRSEAEFHTPAIVGTVETFCNHSRDINATGNLDIDRCPVRPCPDSRALRSSE